MTITEYVKRLSQERDGHEVAIQEIGAKLSVANKILSNHVHLENSPERALRRAYYEMHRFQDPVYDRLGELPFSQVDHLMRAMENRTMTEAVYNQILEGKHPDVPNRTLYERLNNWFVNIQYRFDSWLIEKSK